MQHPDEGTIHGWLDGALSAEEAARVEAHVNECAQCQAAVAEARGFIAASSRILTALDNVPRGVVPAAKPKSRIAPWAWRVAATVLFVAAGTLVVVRRTGVNQSPQTTTSAEATAPTNDSSRKTESAASSITGAPTPAPAVAPVGHTPAPSAQRAQPPSAFAPMSRAALPRETNQPPDAAAATSALRVDQEQNQTSKTAGGGAGIPGRGAPGAAPASPTPSVAAPPQFGAVMGNVAQARAPAVADIAAGVDEAGVRPVGNRRAIGQKKITLYEVAPGDTVELAEQIQVQLEAVVATGASAARTMSGQGNVPATGRATAKASAPTADASAPPTLSAPSPISAVGVNTINWIDSTGRVMKLSGRHTPAELEKIRQRIERLRATTRADSLKKNR